MVDNFIKYLEFEKRYSKHTLISYSKDLDQFQDFLLHTFEISAPDEALHPHLRSWIVQLVDEGISSKSINRKIATLKSFYKFLQGREYVQNNPASRLKPLKTDKRLPSFVKETEMDQLLERIPYADDFSGKRDKIIIELLYSTGIRLSELINLKQSDVSEYEKSVKVLGKRNKERIIPVSDSIIKQLKSYESARKSEFSRLEHDFLIVTDKGDQLYPMFVYRLMKKYLGMVTTLSKKSPHVLRHTFATHLLNKGADLNAVKDLLGHTSLAATQVYTHNSLEKLKTAFDQAHPKA